jgi:hypothetical protein
MHSTTFLFVFFLKGVVVVVAPTCIRLLPRLKQENEDHQNQASVVPLPPTMMDQALVRIGDDCCVKVQMGSDSCPVVVVAAYGHGQLR